MDHLNHSFKRVLAKKDVDTAIKKAMERSKIDNLYRYAPRRIPTSLIDMIYLTAISNNGSNPQGIRTDELSINTEPTLSILSSMELKFDKMEERYNTKSKEVETTLESLKNKIQQQNKASIPIPLVAILCVL